MEAEVGRMNAGRAEVGREAGREAGRDETSGGPTSDAEPAVTSPVPSPPPRND